MSFLEVFSVHFQTEDLLKKTFFSCMVVSNRLSHDGFWSFQYCVSEFSEYREKEPKIGLIFLSIWPILRYIFNTSKTTLCPKKFDQQ